MFTSMYRGYLYIVLILYNISYGNADLLDYFKNIGSYLGYDKKEQTYLNDDILDHTVPYEVSVPDEKFISEAAKLTGVALSELDTCQHRVVLRLQTSCDKMNDEQLAKMAVMLLNCQSSVEGRRIYPCTDTMSIRDCTSNMDADTWNSYHLMSNRARAVCYSVRQIQFRGLTEHTVNRLMDAARNQLFTLTKIAQDQENLHDIAEKSLTSVAEGQEKLSQQQKDLQSAQLHGQLAIENNIRRLADEKQLILETHQQLTEMTLSVQRKLELASLHLEKNADESRINHQELLDDLIAIQNKAQIIFQRIEDSSELLLKQSEAARRQYEVTLAQLAEVNATVHSLVTLVGGTRKALEERLAWISAALGGTDLAVDRLCAIIWHVAFLLLTMITCAFLGANIITRIVVASFPPMNLILTLQQSSHALDIIELVVAIGGFIFVQTMIFTAMAVWRSKVPQQALPWIKQKLTPKKSTKTMEDSNHTLNHYSTNVDHNNEETYNNRYEYRSSHTTKELNEDENSDNYDESTLLVNRSCLSRSRSRTPSSLNGTYRRTCNAKTRMGTPCKISSLAGRDYCYKHLSGDSIFAG